MPVIVGVQRAVIDMSAGDDAEFETFGSLNVIDDGDPPFTGTFVLYTLDLERLMGMLEAAQGGEPVAAIVLALDAAALE